MCEDIEASLGNFNLTQKRIKDQVKLVTFVLLTKACRDDCIAANLFSLLSNILSLLCHRKNTQSFQEEIQLYLSRSSRRK